MHKLEPWQVEAIKAMYQAKQDAIAKVANLDLALQAAIQHYTDLAGLEGVHRISNASGVWVLEPLEAEDETESAES